ncbi:streptomycin kinase (plasmid) [Salipiger sp. CCB-MM3]|uniref:aminoglycoside phosphotransferase family protein n=1 Tax=Salipiger sp. CCB-MM3 TaxID=1792508 RepID=UPI00080ABD20|nr:aminoglycoside phosphotransferase family protein [Salipiger sp. CCB-MM3]ANT62943.1 streptomycin kinase [Salipiger sp. CCB-MM3]
MFTPYLLLWNLTPDGPPITTPSSALLPVTQGTMKAMLKVALTEEERVGADLMKWWAGDGAARVLAQEGGALLLERAVGSSSLTEMAQRGQDEDATRILCRAVADLHAPREAPLPMLTPLGTWFRALGPMARQRGGVWTRCHEAAEELLSSGQEAVPLHGDIHHGNVLDFGSRGWLAIDPKGLLGERGFDYANIFTNPDLAEPNYPVATDPDIFAARLAIVTKMSALPRQRLLKWIAAWCGLSAAWFFGDGEGAPVDQRIAEMAIGALKG